MIDQRPSRQTEIWITLAGLLGALIFFGFYDQAFPSAALDLKLSRQQVAGLAEQTLLSAGYDLAGGEVGTDYRSSLTFARDWWASPSKGSSSRDFRAASRASGNVADGGSN